ncbi:unnamed protein product [Ilex paraguariensis]|uniref:Senescence regulator n=1 Tax=Ilex paraguariensis TaxID=185542 RepID=A0ABC8SRI3_9AQUA
MDPNGVVHFRHRRSPSSSSSDRFLNVFSPPNSDTAITIAGDELNEDDVFWTGHFSESNQRSKSPATIAGNQSHHRMPFQQTDNFGILAALPEDHSTMNRPVIYRKPLISSPSSATSLVTPSISSSTTSFDSFPKHSISPSFSTTTSSSRTIPSIPKPPPECYQSVPGRKFQQSAPVNVPAMPRKVPKSELTNVDDDVDDDEMLPPHEIVARGSAQSPKTTFSVLEGVGRTLKGRDLRQVRNAVWRQTGFLD